jgi:hypothetical protein
VFQYSTHSLPSRRTGESAEDFDRRAPGKVARNLTFLIALIALAIFIFTPTAERFAHSPTFLPSLAFAGGGYALFTVVGGAMTGKIEPFTRGYSGSYERETEPKRFWASMIWNTALGAMSFWIGFMMIADAGFSR